jgi:hypothetical protein
MTDEKSESQSEKAERVLDVGCQMSGDRYRGRFRMFDVRKKVESSSEKAEIKIFRFQTFHKISLF